VRVAVHGDGDGFREVDLGAVGDIAVEAQVAELGGVRGGFEEGSQALAGDARLSVLSALTAFAGVALRAVRLQRARLRANGFIAPSHEWVATPGRAC
jgi:hypothetical protein